MLPLADAAGLPLGSRLAGRHQRHAGDDRLQFEGGRLLQDDGRARADADAGHPGRARGEDPRFVARDYWEVHARFGARRASTPAAGSTGSFKKDEDAERAIPSASGRGARTRSSPPAGASRASVTEETKPSTQLSPLLFDLDQPAARGERALRLLGAQGTLSIAQALYERTRC
jgi:hypothetical protein